MRSKLITLAVCLWMGGFCASSAIADQTFWITPTGGAFDDPTNWSTAMVPKTSDNPIFNLPAPYTVTFSTLANTGPLSVTDGDVTFDLMSTSYSVDGNVDIGGSLTVNSGTLEAGGDINIFSGASLKGNGTLSMLSGGSVINSGTVAPGDSSGILPGIITIAGDYLQTVDGVLAVSIDGLNNFGQVVVEGTASLGGRLVIDASSYTATIGTEFEIVVADTFDQGFDSIRTVGGDGAVFFAPVVLPLVISPGLAAMHINCQGNGNIISHFIGDMDLDGDVDGDDADDFVQGLLDPSLYEDEHCTMSPVETGNFLADDSFDFDDIEGFTQAVEGLVAADIFALTEQMSVPEPTSCGLLLLASGLLGATRSRRLKRDRAKGGPLIR